VVDTRPTNETNRLWLAIEIGLTSEFDPIDYCAQQEGHQATVHPQRERRPPVHLKDYVCHAIQRTAFSPI